MTDILIHNEKKNVIFDATLLTSTMQCGRYTDLRFNHSFVQMSGKSNSLEAGSIVHKVLEVFYHSLANGFKRELAIANGLTAGELYISGCPFCTDFIPFTCDNCSGTGQITKDVEINGDDTIQNSCGKCIGLGQINKPVCGHQANEYPGVKNTPMESEGFKTGWKYVLNTCEQYFEHYKNDFWTPLETEVVKREILYEDDSIRIMWKAKLDLTVDTNQGIYPVDHKTMKQRRDTLSLNNQFIGQCLIMKTRSVIINKIGFQTSLKPAEKFTRAMLSYSADRLLEWQSEILPYWAYQLLQMSESGYWPTNFTNCESKYSNCMYTGVCESDRGMREEELKLHFVIGQKWDPSNDEKE